MPIDKKRLGEDATNFTYNVFNDYPREEESKWEDHFHRIKNDYTLQREDVPMYLSNLAVNGIIRY